MTWLERALLPTGIGRGWQGCQVVGSSCKRSKREIENKGNFHPKNLYRSTPRTWQTWQVAPKISAGLGFTPFFGLARNENLLGNLPSPTYFSLERTRESGCAAGYASRESRGELIPGRSKSTNCRAAATDAGGAPSRRGQSSADNYTQILIPSAVASSGRANTRPNANVADP